MADGSRPWPPHRRRAARFEQRCAIRNDGAARENRGDPERRAYPLDHRVAIEPTRILHVILSYGHPFSNIAPHTSLDFDRTAELESGDGLRNPKLGTGRGSHEFRADGIADKFPRDPIDPILALDLIATGRAPLISLICLFPFFRCSRRR